MPIVVKNPNASEKLDEFVMLELQGDVECREEELKDLTGQFVGDLLYNKFAQPILIIGHHILNGKEKSLDKPFAVLEKVPITSSSTTSAVDDSIIETQQTQNFSILDDTINIEHRTKPPVEYLVRAIIKKKLVFNQRPRPIISLASAASTS